MRVCNSWITLPQLHRPLNSLYIISFLLFLIIPSATSLAFNFSNFYDHRGEIVFGNNESYITSQGLQITTNEYGDDRRLRAGRSTYISPLHLWDTTTREMVDFTTHFSFVIDSLGRSSYADGLSFFFASNNSVITAGGAFGLPIDPETINATDQFVAVEFDTFSNRWDPVNSTNSYSGDHVGIDINSLTSVTFESWRSNITGGRENEAWITYNATSQNLSVIFTGFQNNTPVNQTGLSQIVDLREHLPEWVIFGFGASTGALFQENNVRSWSFNSTNLRIDENQETRSNRSGLIAGLVIGSCILVGGFVLVGYFLWKKRRRLRKEEEIGMDNEMDNEFEKGTGPKKFSYDGLARATNNFAEDEKLGEGGFGGVYRGYLQELSSYVAVKRVSGNSKQGVKEYASEVKIISRLRHKNLVQLIGWCHEKGELLLVYEFMENGSLDFHLFKGKSLLAWEVRFKIAQGLASALLYLHEEWEQCVVHRDIKSSNIMLDSSFNAKLGDFGLARLVDHEKGSQTTIVAGTMGYMAPECVITGKASKESDVFSFGIVALEIACGRKPIVFKEQDSHMRLVEWVWDLYGMGKLHEAVDPKISADFDEKEAEILMIVGLWCAHPDSKLRPSIRQAIHVLNLEASLPILTLKMPVATYFAPPSLVSSSYDESNEILSLSYPSNTDSSQLSSSPASFTPSRSLLNIK